MKKNSLTLILAIITSATFAQSINFGIKGGFNWAEQKFGEYYEPYSVGHKYIPGFNAGAIMNIDLPLGITIQPGLSFTTKGVKISGHDFLVYTHNDGFFVREATFNLSYINAAANVLYNIRTGPGLRLHVGGGGYLAYLTSAKFNVPHATDRMDYKDPDYGVNFIGGIELKKRILIDTEYDLGLRDISFRHSETKNRVISLSVGYLFK